MGMGSENNDSDLVYLFITLPTTLKRQVNRTLVLYAGQSFTISPNLLSPY